MEVRELEQLVREALDEIKAEDTVVLDVEGRTPVTDRIVVTTGNSKRHVQAVARNVVDTARARGVRPLGVEGEDTAADWVLIDLGDAVVHVMTAESRDFYRLERMWEMDDKCASTSSQ